MRARDARRSSIPHPLWAGARRSNLAAAATEAPEHRSIGRAIDRSPVNQLPTRRNPLE